MPSASTSCNSPTIKLDQRADVLAERLHTETSGNPFFMREVLLHLAEDGHLYGEDGRWTVGTDSLTAVPVGARDVISRRLARLSEQARTLLTRAAVIGKDFGLRVLQDVTGFDEEAVFDGLEQAMAARLVEEVELDRYRFTHALVRAALLDGLSASRRAPDPPPGRRDARAQHGEAPRSHRRPR